MKSFLLLTGMLCVFSMSALAQTGYYCNCYHKDGSAITVSLEKTKKVSWGEEGNLSGIGIGYQRVTRPYEVSELVQKYISSGDPVATNLIYSAEIFKLLKHPVSKRERNIINFFDSRGKLLYMSEQRGERITKCEGSASGPKSFCAQNW